MVSGNDKQINPYQSGNLRKIKNRIREIAQDLCYPPKVFKDIEKAKSEEELDRIMRSARKGEYNNEKE